MRVLSMVFTYTTILRSCAVAATRAIKYNCMFALPVSIVFSAVDRLLRANLILLRHSTYTALNMETSVDLKDAGLYDR